MRGFFARLVDPQELKPVKGVDYHDGAPGKDGTDGRNGTDATLPYLSGAVRGLSVDVSSFGSGNVRKVVNVPGMVKGDIVTWSYADGSKMPNAISNAGAFCAEDGKCTLCFTVASVLGLSLGSIGTIQVNAVWFR